MKVAAPSCPIGRSGVISNRKGTAVRKSDRKSKGRQEAAVQPPLALLVDVRRTAYEFVIEHGLAALGAQLRDDVRAACGAERYGHLEERSAYRHGHAEGRVVLGGRSVTMSRPRVRTRGGEEHVLPTWAWATREDPLDERATEQMMIGVSTRKYARSLDRLPETVEEVGTSKSAVSRRFVRETKRRLADVLGRSLREIDLAVLLIDGVHFADNVVLIAIGVDAEGGKHVLGLREGATENATSCTQLLADLVERGLRSDRSILVVLDGAKALRKAVRDVFGDRAVVQRCQVHKKRNVLEQLPESRRPAAGAAMSEAYRSGNPKTGKKLLENLARTLDVDHPGAASSVREGLDETLTVMAFGLPELLERTLCTTNMIENVVGRIRDTSGRVRRWKGGSMIVRWLASGLLEAARGFRRLKGHDGMKKLLVALRSRDARIDAPVDTIVSNV